MKIFAAIAVLFLTSAFASPLHADSMDSADTLWNINGSMTLGGVSSSETINYSFVLDVSSGCPISIPECVIGAVTSSSFGPLGTFVSEDRLLPDHGIYLAFDAPGLDQIDMYLGVDNGVPFAMPSNLWTCLSPTCVADFGYSGSQYTFTVANEFAAVDPPSIPTPEPASILLSGMGMLALLGFQFSNRNKTS